MVGFLTACRYNPTAGSTTDWTFSSAVTGYQSPTAAGVVNGVTYRYRAESADLSQWEVGVGAYNTGTGVLARTTIECNSSGGTSKINFSTTPQVAIVVTALDFFAPSSFSNSLSGDVAMSAGVYASGPTCAQGTTGTFFASGSVAINGSGTDIIYIKLWDGTTVIDSDRLTLNAAGNAMSSSLSGKITSPAGNIRIDAQNSAASGNMLFNNTGNSKDCTLTVFRIG